MSARVLLAIAAVFLTGLITANAQAASGLVAAYSFDENTGTTLGDQSGNGKDGTIVGGSWTAGKYGSALSFNGTSSRVDLPQLGTFYKTGFTLEAWVDKTGTKKDVAVVGAWDWPAGGPMLWVDHIAGHHYVTLNTGLENYLDSGHAPVTGQWQHIAATYDGTTVRYYIDGAQVATRTFSGNAGDFNTWRIGAYGGTPYGFFDGAIDDVRIYNHAITGAEVQSDMATRVGEDLLPPTAPTAFAKTGATATTLATSWNASTDDVGVAGYRVYRGGTLIDGTVTTTSYTYTGLTCSTSYNLGVEAYDSAGHTSARTPLTASSGACDTTPPSVALTAPGAGATVSGVTTVTASASDNTGVAGVQFKLDGANLGSEDTNSPYSFAWDTATTSPGSHTLTAVARDTSGNTTTSAPVTVTVAAPPAGSGPIAAYSFDDGAGTIAGDATGNGKQGTIVNATWTSAGKYGSALDFNGTNARVDLPALGVFYKAGFSLEAWVKKSGAKKDVAIVGSWDFADHGGPMLWIDDVAARYRATLGNSASDFVDSGQSPSGAWQHIAATYDGATARFYVNGALVASKAFTGNVGDTNAWRIGAYNKTPYGFFDGTIDDVRIYDHAIGAALIAADMATPVASSPAVIDTTPASGATDQSAAPKVTAKFNMAMTPASVNTTTVQVKTGSTVVPATVSYDAATSTATLNVTSALDYDTTYTVTVKGGAAGVKSAGGGAMATDRTWSFTVVAKPPILLITQASRPFSAYTGEILDAEGLAQFTPLDLSLVTPSILTGFDTVIVGDAALSSTDVTELTDYVNAGGNLIAMRPDKKLASLLGILDYAGVTMSNNYMKVDTSAGTPGAGITSATMQYHGTADRYLLNGATAVATLYSTATSSTSSPAVTLRSVGANGGQAAAFTYDLARSVTYTRQGNPAWVGQDRDGIFPTRTNDLFFGAKVGDVQPDWVDLNKVAIPQADEQQRLLANLITAMSADRKPVPRLWYFPHSYKSAVVMTGDDHAEGGTAGRFNKYLAASPAGCSVSDWECVRSTSYLFNNGPLTNAQAKSYTAQGFEVALHPWAPAVQFGGCANWTTATLPGYFDTQLAVFRSQLPDVPRPATERMHCVTWEDWATLPKVDLANGIRLDTNYYYYPGSWMASKPGFMTGSGMPMRFADTDGTTIDVYQANTDVTDESGQAEPSTINALLDNAVGANGYYGAFVANIHTDESASTDSDAIVAAAQARDVPIISAKQLLDWTDARADSTLDTFTWANTTLGFKVHADAHADGLTAMLPMTAGSRTLQSITLNGGISVPFTTRTIKGISYAFFDAATGTYSAKYQ